MDNYRRTKDSRSFRRFLGEKFKIKRHNSVHYDPLDADFSEIGLDDPLFAELDENNIEFYDDKEEIEKVQIFGTDGKRIIPILTDSKGRLLISGRIIISPVSFKEVIIRDLVTKDIVQATRTFDLARYTVASFIVVNHGSNSATVQLEESPNQVLFQFDPPEMLIDPGSFKVFTPTRFVRFARVTFRSTHPAQPTKIDIFFQAQGSI